MAEHYRKQQHIVQESERLKRQASSMKEQLGEYELQIQKNYDKIELHSKEKSQLESIAGEELAHWLREQAQA